ncbi:energy transducer TonB [Spongiibacter taiwanensis]|uniref:energy transducer TonB n=1 Tax=Spongiibacter taiwanensis TaxID=1748242 RepID=UPI002035A35D|nr:energy transducer TonB [Spongiibacter taiwanensis]USA44793.1 energy transducer TonB [Spongiibacter taiwanensis]
MSAIQQPLLMMPQEDHRPPERLGFILVLATAMHIALILGIRFAPEQADVKLPTLEITVASYQSLEAPDKADYLAQHDQQGSGTLDEKAELSAVTDSAFHNNDISEQALKMARSDNTPQQSDTISTTAPSSRSSSSHSTKTVLQQRQWQQQDDITEISDNISALEAQLAQLNQAYANMPRPKFITSVAAKGSPDALYLNRWEQRVERIGNANYPEEARRRGIEGELRLLLMLKPDGSVDQVKILRSSGVTLLDRAANRIVRLAAPYEAIPAEVLDGKNRLGIVRTWRFEKAALNARGS